MRKIFTLLACTALASGALFAQDGTIKIGETTYDTLKDAIDNVSDGGTITISGTISINTHRTCAGIAKNYSIVGSDDNQATLNFGELPNDSNTKEAIMLNQAGSYTVTLSNIILDGGGHEWKYSAAIAGERGTLVLDNVTVKNFPVTTGGTDATKNCIINEKKDGNLLLTNVSFENCTVNEGFAMVCTDKNNGLTVEGDNPGISIYLMNSRAFKVGTLENTAPIDVYLAENRTVSTIVTGYTDITKFNFIGCAEDYSIEVEGDNIVYKKNTIAATYNGNSYTTLEAAIAAAAGRVSAGDPARVITLLENVVLSSRQILAIGANVVIEATETKTITRGNFDASNTMFEAKGESGADKPKTYLTFRNIDFVNTNANVTGAMMSVQYGTLTLENVNATYPNKSTNGVIQAKGGGYLVLKNANVGEVLVNAQGNLSLSGNNAITLKLEANTHVEVTDALTNENPIDITFKDEEAISTYVGKVLITGTDLDASKFSVPSGYNLEKSDEGLILKENVSTGVEDVLTEDADAPVEYFNLQGIRVANPENGIFIRRQGNKVSKVAL